MIQLLKTTPTTSAMPQATKTHLREQALAEIASLFALSESLAPDTLSSEEDEESDISDSGQSNSDFNDDSDDDEFIATLFELEGIQWFHIYEWMLDGARGTYTKPAEARAWFIASLSLPDRLFRKLYRYVLSKSIKEMSIKLGN